MKFVTPHAILLLAIVGSSQPLPSASAATCKRLMDTGSAFAEGIKSIAGSDNYATVNEIASLLQPIDTAYPWLSTCLASINPMSVYSSVAMSSGYASCNATIAQYALPEEFTDATVRSSVCPFLGETLIPCINNVAVQAVVDAMAATGGCCDAMKTEIKAAFGTDLKTMVADLLALAGNVACTVKTFNNVQGKSVTQSCLYSLFKSFMSDETSSYWEAMVQMPTDQVCSAVNGQQFTTTGNTVMQFKWAAAGLDAFGICYEPLSALLQTVSAYPIVAASTTVGGTTVSMSDLFAKAKCLQIHSVFKWLLDSDSLLMTWTKAFDDVMATTEYEMYGTNATDTVRRTLKYVEDETPSLCVHMATGQSCSYNGATAAVPFKTTPTTTTTTVASGATSALLVGVAVTFATVVSLSIM